MTEPPVVLIEIHQMQRRKGILRPAKWSATLRLGNSEVVRYVFAASRERVIAAAHRDAALYLIDRDLWRDSKEVLTVEGKP